MAANARRLERHSVKGPSIASLVAVILTFWVGVAPVRAEAPAEVFSAFTAGSKAVVDHAVWSRLLSSFVRPGADGINRLAYARFKAEGQTELKSYIRALEAVSPGKLDRTEQFAFWANLYNAKTIDIVLDHYPVSSIKDISLGGGLLAVVTGGPWKAKVVKVAGRDLSLDDIEHGILRPIFKDPRVHYAVNCASIGCPNLGTQAFTGSALEIQLDAAARSYVNSPRGIRVSNWQATASSIYDWFAADFGGSQAGVLDHTRRYAEPALKRKLESITQISDYDYDWSLNDAK